MCTAPAQNLLAAGAAEKPKEVRYASSTRAGSGRSCWGSVRTAPFGSRDGADKDSRRPALRGGARDDASAVTEGREDWARDTGGVC